MTRNGIRIEPDWNVNSNISLAFLFKATIRIEPDWNVNITKEVLETYKLPIRIEPDWNVNSFLLDDCINLLYH